VTDGKALDLLARALEDVDGRPRIPFVLAARRAILVVPMIHPGRLTGCLGLTRNRRSSP
jgi:hypothetical protein